MVKWPDPELVGMSDVCTINKEGVIVGLMRYHNVANPAIFLWMKIVEENNESCQERTKQFCTNTFGCTYM